MANNYYKKQEEWLRKETCEKYQNLSEQEEDKRLKKAQENYQSFTEEEKERRQYHCERNKNLSEKQKKMLVQHRRNYYITHNKQLLGHLISVSFNNL